MFCAVSRAPCISFGFLKPCSGSQPVYALLTCCWKTPGAENSRTHSLDYWRPRFLQPHMLTLGMVSTTAAFSFQFIWQGFGRKSCIIFLFFLSLRQAQYQKVAIKDPNWGRVSAPGAVPCGADGNCTVRFFCSPCTWCAPSSTRSPLPRSPTARTWWSTASPRPCPTAAPRCSRCPTSAATRRSRSCPTWVPPRRARARGGVAAHTAKFQLGSLRRVAEAQRCCGWKRC